MKSEDRKLARFAKKHGWTVEQNRRGHLMFTSPKGARIVTSSTPSDTRSRKNHIARLRANGLPVPRKGAREK